LSVEFILKLLECGTSDDEILDEYQSLALADVRACQLYTPHSRK
jgi:uncharacterized protein (DUF433 family)